MSNKLQKLRKYALRKFTTGFGTAIIGSFYFLSGGEANASEVDNKQPFNSK